MSPNRTEPEPQQERIQNMDQNNDICNCEWCEAQRKEQGHDPYFSDRDEFDRAQEANLFPDLDFDGDILDLY